MNLSQILYKGGTNFPGKVALKFDKDILGKISKNFKVILVTGTNGKTTTTNMIYSIIKNSGQDAITNETGANMYTGIISCFLKNYRFTNKNKHRYAVIEVDEANVKYVTDYIQPEIIIITNLFRDQLDRYGEVYNTLDKILNGIRKCPDSILVLNGDESLLGALNLPNKILYYGFNTPVNEYNKLSINADAKFCKICKHPYEYNFITYNHLGDFYCPNCGYKRPKLTYSVDKIIDLSPDKSIVEINNKQYYINQCGTYNIYNALCAFSSSKLLGIDDSIIYESLKTLNSSFGRQEVIKIHNKNVKIILVKNPAGFDEALNSINLDKGNKGLALLLNDNFADGRDVSWIWDVGFENLDSDTVSNVMVSGIRLYDMGIRLKVAGFSEDLFRICDDYDTLLDNIKKCKEPIIYLLATYTAMTSFRKFLNSKGYIKKLW
ncbi:MULTISPECIES: Mur ligase family protein [Clostridium]|jgi:lipid II isoglutaminyl synthase (glutamine-hydrolysing)|uniref:Lipid II isoglutaminyl synthase (glutamine-hydrolyzing) subunit MurT n=1 Tax=Clostridium thermopalmarium DSM 5974 TaxID=1121340 RepID=A0A2T0AZ44_9CLOT|nr:Mur ligase family protein [Clostridium thermopalmarium]PRR76473.1 UDP-N-acetylmuramate--L-alanine ligase [Clostridium thermopalmarium DSM 5974]PVZ28414.1 UDP-N-acetylmuramyl tripeptide synthase [Clostridium thermopalmarium DSM 5974]